MEEPAGGQQTNAKDLPSVCWSSSPHDFRSMERVTFAASDRNCDVGQMGHVERGSRVLVGEQLFST